ncbi:hypothetical protein ASPTUDRAFT_205837 [Aspergillus tubingensis CBS 134.48]|uniref:Uncharacterized protein n=1 Tax=Aspergillus tubingensis (strain CBS 134.48) TaxID=767770 RepID=A0A1L9NHM0_ASPTC|nr:hypothetical protein ASPTUDRAFT_205837 [Aspergillus tubingensis CBS 134.48]
MGVKRSFETLIEDFREDARLRVAQTNAVSRHLRRIFTATKAFKHPVLADHDWRHWGSSCLNSTFKEHVQMSNSHFTTHYRKQNYRRLTGTIVSGRVFAAWFRDRKPQPWVHRQCYRANPRIASGEHTPDVPYSWQTIGEMKADSLDIPHCIFQMYNYADPEEPLHRSEVLPIVGFMRWRLNRFNYINHRTFPVLVVSIFRSQARILQAYHDGEYLRISKSKFIDFTENCRENYELFVRWIYSIPCGDTQAPLAIKGEELSQRSYEQIDKGFRHLARQAEAYHERKKIKE